MPRRAMRVQSLLFSRAAWTPGEARRWARRHGYRVGRIEPPRRGRYLRLRQAEPTGRVFRTIPFGRGIKAVVQRNPTIPGEILQIRYRRNDGRLYYHDFKPGVRAIVNADGSVTLRGRRRLWADDKEPGFWRRYGHHRKRKGRNPMARQRGGTGWGWWLLVGGVALWWWTRSQSAQAADSQAAFQAQRAGERTAGDILPPMEPLFEDAWSAYRSGEWAAF